MSNDVNNQAAEQQETVGLNINDLALMKEIIDIASSRAAFKPNEMMAVGQVYAKLSAFLEQVAQQQAEAEKAAQATEQGE